MTPQSLTQYKEVTKNAIDTKSMHACLFYGPRDVRFEKVSVPEISRNEILVKIDTALTCGTDLKTFQRGHPKLIRSIPSGFGHQFSGTVVKAGKNIDKFQIGQRVVALNTTPCFNCKFCKKERYSLCENIEFLNGAYAEYIVLPERIVKNNTYEIPPGIGFGEAAMLESLSVIIHGYKRSEITSDKTLCIIGSGSIGLLFTALAKLNGVKKIFLIGRKDFKLKIAQEFGASHALNLTNFNSQDDLVKEVCRLNNGYGPDVVIEAVGIPETWNLALKMVGRGGLINFFGGCEKGSTFEIDTYRLHYDELKLMGVFHHTPKSVKAALDLLIDKSFSKHVTEKIITHFLPLSELGKAFLLHESGEAIQIAIKPHTSDS